MFAIHADTLEPWARKYVWWKTSDRALQHPLRVIAQVMDIGDYDDVQRLIKLTGAAAFKEAIARAEAGQFSDRSWAYWHYRLGLARPGHLPPAPRRHFA